MTYPLNAELLSLSVEGVSEHLGQGGLDGPVGDGVYQRRIRVRCHSLDPGQEGVHRALVPIGGGGELGHRQ